MPHRNRVVLAKTLASVTVGIAAMLFAMVVGVIGNLIGTAIVGTDLVWDVSYAHAANIVLGSLLCLLTGTMLGILFRSSSVALVAYFVITLLVPMLFGLLASRQARFRDVHPWVNLNNGEAALFDGTLTGGQWAHLAVTVTTWLVLPAIVGIWLVTKSEVK